MDKEDLKQFIDQVIDQKLDSMENLSVPQHFHLGWDASQLDPAVALLGFPVVQVADATVAPTDVPLNGTFRFYVDVTPRYRLWAYMVYVSSAGAQTGAWKVVALT